MSSTRLPGKVMKPLAGRPMLAHVVERASAAKLVDRVVVATSTDPGDDEIARWCAASGVECFRGSLDDVLDRYHRAARSAGAAVIVRITADCPMLDPEIVDMLIRRFLDSGADYAGLDGRFPDGLDCEVFTAGALECAWRKARLRSEREHVTPFIWKNPRRFAIAHLRSERDLSQMRWTVDDERDFAFAAEVFRALGGGGGGGRIFHMRDVLALLEENPRLAEINAGTPRNEGYFKSLREDGIVS
ncbi:MAG TPA: spore coat protein [Deltaproteobacteria bacterium]|nr:spore coat protein [Deltaproteobacteria bacterium]